MRLGLLGRDWYVRAYLGNSGPMSRCARSGALVVVRFKLVPDRPQDKRRGSECQAPEAQVRHGSSSFGLNGAACFVRCLAIQATHNDSYARSRLLSDRSTQVSMIFTAAGIAGVDCLTDQIHWSYLR